MVACQPISGTLSVSEPLELKVTEYHQPLDRRCRPRDDVCEDPVVIEKTDRFAPGTYRAQLNLDRKDAISLTLEPKTRAKSIINLAVPAETYIPKHNGRFHLSAAQTGQPFDLAGIVETTHSVTPIVATWESCSRLLERLICHGHHRGCVRDYIRIFGHHPVEYHHEYETKTVALDLSRRSTEHTLAHFDGSSTIASKIYDYRGYCF